VISARPAVAKAARMLFSTRALGGAHSKLQTLRLSSLASAYCFSPSRLIGVSMGSLVLSGEFLFKSLEKIARAMLLRRHLQG
jgi:hypothetical protein